jgi:hypothetical protein
MQFFLKVGLSLCKLVLARAEQAWLLAEQVLMLDGNLVMTFCFGRSLFC